MTLAHVGKRMNPQEEGGERFMEVWHHLEAQIVRRGNISVFPSPTYSTNKNVTVFGSIFFILMVCAVRAGIAFRLRNARTGATVPRCRWPLPGMRCGVQSVHGYSCESS